MTWWSGTKIMLIEYDKYLKSQYFKNLTYGDIETVRCEQSNGKSKVYSTLPISFDIETTKIDGVIPHSYMYIWQVAINHIAVYGRTWDDLKLFLNTFKTKVIDTHQYTRSKKGTKRKCKVEFFGFIHTISFEWAFCKGNMRDCIGDVFLKEKREPLYFEMCGIKFIDSYQITRMSLAKLANTYCKAQKLTGDLDYSIERSHLTRLSDAELAYCENDVLILNEYQEHYINTYLKNGVRTFVFTQTGIVRAQLKRSFEMQSQFSRNDIINMYPQTRGLYDIYMKYLFRGGYVHGDASLFNQVLYEIDGFDITSAHPYQICSKKFPISKFIEDVRRNIDLDTYTFNQQYAYILDITFEGLKAKGNHSIESMSKTLECNGYILDNGRINSAEHMRVLLTDIDLKIYKMYYTWDSAVLNLVSYARYGYLPRYVVDNVLNAYETKERLKLQKKPYMNEKVFLNSIYGSFVTRIEECTLNYNDGIITSASTNYDKEVNKRILSPFWGIWTTAYTRYQQLSLMFLINGVYGDTDSNKCPHSELNFAVVNKINERIEKSNEVLCKRYHKDFNLVRELGKWDYEGTYDRFKMLGAKRYLYEKNGKIEITCSGLPKSVKLDNPFADFEDGLCVRNCKLRTAYVDDEYTDIVDGVRMVSKSGVSLVSSDFTLSIANEYTSFIAWIKSHKR